MSACDERNTQPDAAHRRARFADMQARLAEFGRLIAQIREELPQHDAQDLSRIEQGIGSLAERVGTLGQEGQGPEHAAPPASPGLPASEDEPWDRQSADALMRIYEAAIAQWAGPAAPRRYRAWPSEGAAAAQAAEPPSQDAAGLEARLAQLALLIEGAVAEAHPAKALAALDRRLDAFEQRLERALSDMALGIGRGDLKLIDAHLVEFAGQFEAIRQQLGRLDAVETALRELARAPERAEAPSGDHSPLSQGAIEAFIDGAAERAASKVTASLPEVGDGEDRLDRLQALVENHVAERRRSEEAAAAMLHSIEDGLMRILDRVEAMEALQAAPPAAADTHAREPDGLEIEHDRLAQAYAQGARVLGQHVQAPTLDAADYVAARRQERRATSTPAHHDIDDGMQEEVRRELRASALRAKLKAQAAESSRPPDAGEVGRLEVDRLGQGPFRTWAPARASRHRKGLLFSAAMALFGAGFVAVDTLLSASPPAAAPGHELVPQPEAGASQALPPPRASDGTSEVAPTPEPASRPPLPDAGREEEIPNPPAPTRRLNRLETGTAVLSRSGATPVNWPERDGSARPADAGETESP
jgi:hypothetical protein